MKSPDVAPSPRPVWALETVLPWFYISPRRRTWCLIIVLVLIRTVVMAQQPLFTFTEIATKSPSGSVSITGAYSINNLGEVAFLRQLPHNGMGVFKGDGGPLVTILEAGFFDLPSPNFFTGVGINDSGMVGFRVNAVGGGQEFVIGNGGPLTSFAPGLSFLASASDINNNGQIGGPFGQDFAIADATGLLDTIPAQMLLGGNLVVINNEGQVARATPRDPFDEDVIQIGTPGVGTQELFVGGFTRVNNSVGSELGFNNLAAVTFFSGPGGNLFDRLEFAMGSDRLVIAETGGDFGSFLGGSPLNNLNMLAFGASDGIAPALFIAAPNPDDAYIPVVRVGDEINGEIVIDIRSLSNHSLNDRGQLAFNAVVRDEQFNGRAVLLRADSAPGVMPGNPLMPINDPSAGEGFRFVIPDCVGLARQNGRSTGCRIWADPDVAIGYSFELISGDGRFESVLIPVPLPMGDQDFLVEFGTHTEPLTAGVPFFFTDFEAPGVSEFSITGIDEAEMLQANDPTAFVTGLTFLPDEQGDTLEMLMTPIVAGDPGSPPALECVGFEPPLHTGPVKVKKNRVLPLRALLVDPLGLAQTDQDLGAHPVVQVTFEPSGGGEAQDVTALALPAGQGTEGNLFVFDPESGSWAFNLKTGSYSAPGLYTVEIVSGDTADYTITPVCQAQFVINH